MDFYLHFPIPSIKHRFTFFLTDSVVLSVMELVRTEN